VVWGGQVEQLGTDSFNWEIGSGRSALARGVALAWVVPSAGSTPVGQAVQVGGSGFDSGQVEWLQMHCISWRIQIGQSVSARGVVSAFVVPSAGRTAVEQGEQVGGSRLDRRYGAGR
jgi:hypothetical protein